MEISRPLRVMYVVPDLGVGGAERHVTTLLPRLDRTRFDPMAVCIGEPGVLFPVLAEHGVPALALRTTRRQAPRALALLVREMRRFRPDLVITRGYNAEILGRTAAFVTRVPRSIVWIHHCGDTEPLSPVRRRLDRFLDPITDAYFGVAQAQKQFMVDGLGFRGDKITIVHNGVDPSLFTPPTPGTPDRAPAVGILAALRPEKDHATFLHAAARIVATRPEVRFLVVGDGPCRNGIESLIAELGLGDHVDLTGARSDVAQLLHGMDVVTLCSHTVECFPMALLEAMAAERPAVCTAVGGIPEMVVDGVTGLLVPPRDPEALANALLDVLSDPERARKMGRAARERVEAEFTLDRSVAAAQAAFDSVARVPSRRRRPGPLRLTLVMDQTFVGGVEVLMLDVFRHFDPEVVRPRVLCLREEGPLAGEYREAGFEVEVIERSSSYDPRRLSRLVRDLRRDRTDAVLVTHHHRGSLALGRIAALLAGVPVNLVAAHDMDLTSVGRRCLPRWAAATLFLSDALVLLGRRQGEYLHREEGVGRKPWSRTREVVITNGIRVTPRPTPGEREHARTALGLAPGDFAVGIVARLSAQKAHEVLFEAMAHAARARPDTKLVVIGDGPRRRELGDLAHRLGIADRVVFTGTRRDVPALLPGLDVTCLSSVHEGAPISVMEAMAAGLPVVATSCGCIPDMVADGVEGYVVPVGDSVALAERLVSLASDTGLAADMGAAARRRAEADYRISQTPRAFERLLAELADQQSRPRPGPRGEGRHRRAEGASPRR